MDSWPTEWRTLQGFYNLCRHRGDLLTVLQDFYRRLSSGEPPGFLLPAAIRICEMLDCQRRAVEPLRDVKLQPILDRFEIAAKTIGHTARIDEPSATEALYRYGAQEIERATRLFHAGHEVNEAGRPDAQQVIQQQQQFELAAERFSSAPAARINCTLLQTLAKREARELSPTEVDPLRVAGKNADESNAQPLSGVDGVSIEGIAGDLSEPKRQIVFALYQAEAFTALSKHVLGDNIDRHDSAALVKQGLTKAKRGNRGGTYLTDLGKQCAELLQRQKRRKPR